MDSNEAYHLCVVVDIVMGVLGGVCSMNLGREQKRGYLVSLCLIGLTVALVRVMPSCRHFVQVEGMRLQGPPSTRAISSCSTCIGL